VAEFKPVRRDEREELNGLEIVKEVLYRLKPPVKGI